MVGFLFYSQGPLRHSGFRLNDEQEQKKEQQAKAGTYSSLQSYPNSKEYARSGWTISNLAIR